MAIKDQRRVILVHDGSIDEYMATLLLFSIENVIIEGIVIVAGNCLPDIGMQTAWKIQAFADRRDIPLTLSSARGFNPFPWEYREDCIRQGNVPALQMYAPHSQWPPFPDADVWLKNYFATVDGKVTIVCLCPLTPLATLFKESPDAQEHIEELIWMGGALNVAGNLDPATLPPVTANPYAEWNIFWDPAAADYVFENTTFPLLLFPLDLTNSAKITSAFLQDMLLRGKKYRQADLAYQSYRATTGAFYCMWDVATVAYLGRPELYVPPISMKLKVIASGFSAGALVTSPHGRSVLAFTSFAQVDAFYAYVADVMSR
jgi:purine nucleosidase